MNTIQLYINTDKKEGFIQDLFPVQYANSQILNQLYFKLVHQHIQRQYIACPCPKCAQQRQQFNLNTNQNKPNFKDTLNAGLNAFKTLFKKQQYKLEDLFNTPEYQELTTQTQKILNASIPQRINQNIINALQQDTLIFSQLKTNAQLTEARQYLIDDKNKIIPFAQFQQHIKKLNNAYNQNYLEAEYILATHSATAIDKWLNFSDNTQRYYLQYRTANDEKVRASHKDLNGITLPKNNPFWQQYYPPNGWRCRCTVTEVLASQYTQTNQDTAIKTAEQATTHNNKEGKNVLALFRFNPATNKILMPPNNAYTKLPGADNIITHIKTQQQNQKEANKNQQNQIFSLPKQQQFITLKTFKNGGYVLQHLNVDTNKTDFLTLKKIATQKAKQGNEVEILPEIHFKETETRNLILPNYNKHPKNPDLKINNEYYEVEDTNIYSNISKRISSASKQADNVIIVYEDDLTYRDEKLANKMFTEHKNLQTIEIQGKNKTEMFKK